MMTILYVEDTKQMKSQFCHSKTIPPLRCHIYAFIMCLNKFHVCTSESEQNTKKVSVETKESTTHRNNKNKKSHIYMCILLDMREACQLFHFMRIIFFSLLHVGNCCRRMAKRIHCARVRASILAKCIIGGIVAKA